MANRRTRSWQVALLLGALITIAAVLGGLISSRATAASPSPTAGKVVLKIGWMGSPDNMNPFIGWTNNVYEIYVNEYLLLCGRDTETLQLDDKGVAKSWEVSPDGLTWTFQINQGMKWHDGEPVTAEDVAFTYNFIIENEVSGFIGFCKNIEKVVVVDPYTAQFVCTRPKANLTRLWIPIVPEHIWSKMDPEYATTKFQNSPPIVGAGPWQVVDWKRNDFVRLVANKDFYLGPPKIDEVLFIVYQTADTMVQDLKAGGLDAAYLFPPAQFEPLKNTPGVAVTEYTWYNWDYIAFNCYEGKSKGHPVLRDQRFRAALEYAIDRDALITVARNGHAIPGYTFMTPDTWREPDYSWKPPDGVRRDFDIEKAKQLLDEAGYPDSDGDGIREYKGKDITLRLWGETDNPEGQRSNKLIAGWFKEAGIDIKLAVYDEGVYFDRIWNYDSDGNFVPDFDIYHWEWDGYFDPGQTLDCFTTAQIEGWNEMAWSNDEFDRLDTVQNETLDPTARADAIHQMQEVMYREAPAIVLTHPYKLAAYRSDKWDGWERANYGKGPAFAGQTNPWAYYSMTPAVAAAEESGGSSSWVVAVAVAAVAVAILAFILIRRGRRARTEEE